MKSDQDVKDTSYVKKSTEFRNQRLPMIKLQDNIFSFRIWGAITWCLIYFQVGFTWIMWESSSLAAHMLLALGNGIRMHLEMV